MLTSKNNPVNIVAKTSRTDTPEYMSLESAFNKIVNTSLNKTLINKFWYWESVK